MDKMCQVCGTIMHKAFTATVLNKHQVNYFQCNHCGLLQTEEPYWLQEAYSEAIAATDTGLVRRNIATAKKLAALIFIAFGRRGQYIDVAGGYGMLTRLMRDAGFDFYWDDKYCKNLHAYGFDAACANPPFEALTAFEALEHVHEPIAWLLENFQRFGVRTLIFSTELYVGSAPPLDWWYYSFGTGQHITFYRRDTFEIIASRLGLAFFSVGGFHILTDKSMRNLLLYKTLSRHFATPLQIYMRRNLSPKTWADHQKIAREMNSPGNK